MVNNNCNLLEEIQQITERQSTFLKHVSDLSVESESSLEIKQALTLLQSQSNEIVEAVEEIVKSQPDREI